jgi:membrane protein YqaA with SNARE-associated domain
MFDIGGWIYDLLSPLGIEGLLICLFLLFFIDSIVFPTLPELFTVIVFMVHPQAWFAGAILAIILLAEFLGFSTLYFIVTKIKVPRWIQNMITRYTCFLIVRDEKVVLVNRIAPVVPFIGAFAAVLKWNYKKCVLYTFAGGFLKYGAILAMSNLFFVYLSSGMAQTVTLILIIVIIAISFAVSFWRRKHPPIKCDLK